MHDINEQTYVPGTCTSLPDSLYLLIYKRKHPQTLGCISDYVRKIISIIFSSNMHHMFLTFPFTTLYFSYHYPPASPFILLQHITVYLVVSITIKCANLTCFHALTLLNRREIDKQYLHCLVSMPF